MMDKKIIWKFNLIDLIIIALVILSLIALVYKIVQGSNNDIKIFEVVCVCDEAPNDLLYGISSDSECIDGASGTELGKVVSSEVQSIDETSDKSKGIITLSVEGIKNDHGISVRDTVYLKGSNFSLIVGDSVFDVYINDIK